MIFISLSFVLLHFLHQICLMTSVSHTLPPVPLSFPPSRPQRMEHRGIRFWCYNAGHVLGAAMFMIEIGGLRVLYTGDYSMEDDR